MCVLFLNVLMSAVQSVFVLLIELKAFNFLFLSTYGLYWIPHVRPPNFHN